MVQTVCLQHTYFTALHVYLVHYTKCTEWSSPDMLTESPEYTLALFLSLPQVTYAGKKNVICAPTLY